MTRLRLKRGHCLYLELLFVRRRIYAADDEKRRPLKRRRQETKDAVFFFDAHAPAAFD